MINSHLDSFSAFQDTPQFLLIPCPARSNTATVRRDWRRGTLRQRDIYCTGRDGTPLVGLAIRTYQRVGRSLTVGDMHHRFMIHIQRNQSRQTMAIVCNMGNGQWDIMCHHVVLIPVILLSPCILNPLCRPGNLNNPNF